MIFNINVTIFNINVTVFNINVTAFNINVTLFNINVTIFNIAIIVNLFHCRLQILHMYNIYSSVTAHVQRKCNILIFKSNMC